MSKKKTHEEFLLSLKEKYPFDNLIFIERYIDRNTKILCKCKDCNNEFYVSPSHFVNHKFNNKYCPFCNKKIKKTTDIFKKEIKNILGNKIEILGEYIGSNKKIKCKCNICDYIWESSPTHLLNNHGCPKCGQKATNEKNTFLTTDIISNRIKSVTNSINTIGKYNNNTGRIKCQCKECGHVWNPKVNNILKGSRCPNCYMNSNISKLETKVKYFLDLYNIEYLQQYRFNHCKDKTSLPFDFYLPKYNCCIECDGIQHFEPIEYFCGEEYLKIVIFHDKIKNKYCKNNNIGLIRINYKQYKDIYEILDKYFLLGGNDGNKRNS